MSSQSMPQLWTPSVGIRFSPTREPAALYPDLSTWVAGVGATRYMSSGTAWDQLPAAHGDIAVDQPPIAWSAEVAPSYAGKENEAPAGTEQAGEDAKAEDAPLPPPQPAIVLPPFLEPGQLPRTESDFQPSKARYEVAQKSAENAPESYWSHKLYNRPNKDGSFQEVKVHYCSTKTTAQRVLTDHFRGEPVLGFDMEWAPWGSKKSVIRENASLIQIASPSHIALIHIALFREKDDDLVVPALKEIVEDASVLKAGINILGDMTRLKNLLGITAAGSFELSHLYKLVLYSRAETPQLINRMPVGMEKQVKAVLGLPVFKGSVRTSNWMKPLTEKQITYAAADAYAGVQLFYVMEKLREKLDPCPPRPQYAEYKLPIQYVTKNAKEAGAVSKRDGAAGAEGGAEDGFVVDDTVQDSMNKGQEAALMSEEESACSSDESSEGSFIDDASLRELAEADLNARDGRRAAPLAAYASSEDSSAEASFEGLDQEEPDAVGTVTAAAPTTPAPRPVRQSPRTTSAPSSTTRTSLWSRLTTQSQENRDSRIQAADRAVKKHPRRTPQAAPRELRAYYAWHLNKDLPPDKVAALLRDPPLATNTVVSYIADAIATENLPYSRQRMASELLSSCHNGVMKGRWAKLAGDCDYKLGERLP